MDKEIITFRDIEVSIQIFMTIRCQKKVLNKLAYW